MSKETWLQNQINLYTELVKLLDMRPEHDGADHRKEYRKYIEKCKQELKEGSIIK